MFGFSGTQGTAGPVDEEMQEVALDGEILEDEVDPQILKMNEMEMKARQVLLQQSSSMRS